MEHRLDGLEAELTAREQVLTAAEASLNESRKQLDDLRRELAKHPHAADAGTVLMPSRKAAEMIAAGALGAGYDPDAAHVVEAKRKEESVKKSREEWRAKAEETEGDVKQTKENLKRMADHAATAYNTRTKEIKTRSAGGSGRGPAVERLMSINLRKAIMTGHAESEPRRSSLATVQSVEGSVANSTGSRKRLALFRRRRRTTGATQDEDMSERDLSISLQP